MKKTLLLFAMLLGVLGAWAQEDKFVTPEAGKYYIIKGDHATHHWLTGVVESGGIDVSDNREDAGIYYYDGTSLKLYNSQTYIGKNNQQISLVGTKTNVTLTSHGTAGKYIINVGGHNLYNNQSDYTREAGNLTADTGNRYTWGFILVDNIKKLNLTSAELKSGSSIYTYHHNSNSGGWYGKLQTKTTPKVVIEAENKQFNGVGWSSEKPYLKQGAVYNISVPAGYKITEYSMTTIAGENFAGTYTYTTSGEPATSQAAGTVNVTGLSTDQICLELTSGSGGIIISNLNLTYEIEQISYSLTDDAGNVYTGSGLKRYDKDELAIGGVDEYTLSNGKLENGVYTANISFPVPVSKTDSSADKEVIICAYKGSLEPGVAKYFVDGDTQIKANPSGTVADKKDRWVIYPTCTNGNFTFAIKNVGTGKYIKSNFDNAQKDAEGAVVVAESGYTNFTISEGNRFRVPVTKNGVETYLSVGSSDTKNKVVGLWSWYGGNGIHNGISNFVYEAQLPYVITDNFGNKYLGTIDASTGNPNTLTPTGVPSNWLSEFTFDGMKKTATITFPFHVSSETKINPTMISSFGGNINKWYATEAGTLENGVAKKVSVIGTKKNQDPTDANRMTYMWAIYPKFDNGSFTFQVKNLATDTYVYSTSDAQTFNLGTVTLAETGADFTFENNSFKLNSGKYLSINSSTATGVQYIGTWTHHSGCNLSFPTVEDVNFELVIIKSEIEGYEETNPNTHLGTVSIMNGTFGNQVKLGAKNSNAKKLYLDRSKEISLTHTRNYRGYKFLGFWLGETKLDETPLTTEQVNAISETNPIIAKYEVIPGEVTLFYDDDAFSYRIPAIAKTSTGRLIAVSDYRHNLDDIGRDNHGTGTKRIDLVARTSDDNGQTWSETMTIAAGDDSKSGTYQRAFGDAAIVAVGENIVVMAAAGDQVYPSATTASPNRMARIFSNDNGETWSISEITTQMYNSETSLVPNGVAAFFGSGKLVVDENFNGTGKARIYGALLVRINNNGQYDNYNNYVLYSDDLGENWKILGGSTEAIAKGDEPKVEILPSGQILLSARRVRGRIFNVFTYGEEADDKTNGSGSWATAENGCNNGGENGTNGEIMCIDAKKPDGTAVSLLLQSQPKGGNDQYDRKNVTIWYKEISNSTYTPSTIAADWTEGLQVSTQKSAYSAMAEQADGKIAFFFEEAPCYGDDHTKGYSMVYVPLTLEKITGGKYADKNAQAKTVTVTVTDSLGNTYNESLNIFVSDEEAIKNMVESKWAFANFGEEPTVVTDGTSITYTNTVILPFKVSNEENTYWHNIYFPANTQEHFYPVYLSASGADDEFVPKVTESQRYGASSYNTKDYASNINWAIYSVNNGLTFKFKNELTGKFIQATSVANDNAQNVKYVDEANATAFEIIPDVATYKGDYALKASIGNSVGYLCSTSVGYANATHYSGNGHQGAWVKFVEAPNFDYYIGGINTELKAIGTAVGLYATDDDVEAARTAMASANTVKWNTLEEYYQNIRRDGREVNAPSVGMYRIKNKNTGAYIHGNANGTISLASKFDNYTSIFYLNENNQLISYRMGRHLDGQAKNLAEVNTACDVEFNVAYGGVTEGVLTIKSNGAWIGYILNQPTIESSTVGTQSAAYDWTFEKVEWLPVPVNTSVGYATLYSPVALNTFAPKTKNHRVEAYIGTINGDRFSMEQVDAKDGIIPANTPVILVYKQDAENGLVYLQVVDSDEVAPAENGLSGTFESSYIEDDAYVLSKPTIDGIVQEVGLYKADKNFYENNGTWTKDTTIGTTIGTHFLNNGFKAYLPASEAASDARFLVFSFGDDIETGITETENGNVKTENDEVYDLSGRRVQGTQKGIFIVNGKKVVR